MSDNPFTRLAERQISNPVKSRMKAAQTRKDRRLQKAMYERNYLYREWKAWHDKRKAELLSGSYAEAAGELAEFLEGMSLYDGEKLIALVAAGPWLESDADTRFEILALINRGIVYRREAEGCLLYT